MYTARLTTDVFPAASRADTCRMRSPSGKSATRRKQVGPRVSRARLWQRPCTREALGLAAVANRCRDALNPGIVRRRDGHVRLSRSSAHPPPARERAVQRDRWWDRVVDGHLDCLGVDRCSGEALVRAADDQLVDSGRALWGAEGHWPAAVVECGRVAVLPVRQAHDRGSARQRSEERAPTAVVSRQSTRPAHRGDRRSGWRPERVPGVVETRVGPADQTVADASGVAASRWARFVGPAGIPERRPGGAAEAEQPCGVARNNGVRTGRRGLRAPPSARQRRPRQPRRANRSVVRGLDVTLVICATVQENVTMLSSPAARQPSPPTRRLTRDKCASSTRIKAAICEKRTATFASQAAQETGLGRGRDAKRRRLSGVQWSEPGGPTSGLTTG